jgi:hypothetical protein
VPEHTNNPAKVVLMELPSRSELRQKNLFSVADLRMTWHDQGHFLCVKVCSEPAYHQSPPTPLPPMPRRGARPPPALSACTLA